MNWVDFVILIVLLVTTFIGVARGLFKSVATLVGVVLAIILAVQYSPWLAANISRIFSLPPNIRFVAALLVIFIVTLAILKLLGYIFYKLVSLTPLKVVDKIGGGVLGFLKGLVLLSVVLVAMIFFPFLDGFGRAIDRSLTGPVIRQVVPFIYELSAPLHPNSGHFVDRILDSVLDKKARQFAEDHDASIKEGYSEITAASQGVLRNINRYFGKKKN